MSLFERLVMWAAGRVKSGIRFASAKIKAVKGRRRALRQENARLVFWAHVSEHWQGYVERKRRGALRPWASPTKDDWTTDYAGVGLADAAAGQPGGLWRVKPGQTRPQTQAEYEQWLAEARQRLSAEDQGGMKSYLEARRQRNHTL